MLSKETIVLSCGTEAINNDIFGDVRNHAVEYGTNWAAFINSLIPFENEAMQHMESTGYFKENKIDPHKYQVMNTKGKTKWVIQGDVFPKGWKFTGHKKWKYSLITGAYKSAKSQIVQAMKEGVAINNEMSRQDLNRARKAKKPEKEKEPIFVTCVRYAEFISSNKSALSEEEKTKLVDILGVIV